jgi:hypothetical protein
MSIEAMKKALKGFEKIYEGCSSCIEDKLHEEAISLARLVRKDCERSIDTLRKAIEQAEKQGVITYRTGYESGYMDASVASKREWVGIEDEDVATVKNEFNRGALWAEALLKGKNT